MVYLSNVSNHFQIYPINFHILFDIIKILIFFNRVWGWRLAEQVEAVGVRGVDRVGREARYSPGTGVRGYCRLREF